MLIDLDEILLVPFNWLTDKISFFIIYVLLVVCITGIAFLNFLIKKKKIPYIDLDRIISCKIIQNAIYIIYNVYLFNRFVGAIGSTGGGIIGAIQFLLGLLPFSLLVGTMYTPISFLTSLFYIRKFKLKNIMLWFVTTIPYFDLVIPLILRAKHKTARI